MLLMCLKCCVFMLVHSRTYLLHKNFDNYNVFWTLKPVHLRLPIRTNLVYNFVICMSVHLRLPLYRILYFVTFVHLRSPTAQWAYWWAVTYCCIVWIVVRQPIGSLKSLRPVTPNHNKVVSPNQSLLVYSSGILDNTVLPSICSRYICKVSYGRTGWHQ